jgi:hypothetical protein
VLDLSQKWLQFYSCWNTYTLEGGLGSGVGLLGALGGSYIIIRISNRSYSELAKSAAA